MMKNQRNRNVSWILTAILALVLFSYPAAPVEAKSKVVDIEGMRYSVHASLKDNLQSLIGKRVYITLESGKAFAGTIKAVGEHLVHVEKIMGKDFFDALILIEDISAIDAKFRDYQR